MPYEIAKLNGKFLVRKKTDKSKVFGTHPTYEKALAQLRAIEVNSHEHANFPSQQQSTGKRIEVRKHQ